MRAWLVVSVAVFLGAAAHGQVKVMDTEDVVTLVSGEKLTGKVIGAGLKAVVVVVAGEEEGELVERTIPREQVQTIARGGFSPMIKAYATGTVEGVKVVTGESDGTEEEPAAADPAAKGPGRPAGKGQRGGRKGGKQAPKEGGGKGGPQLSRGQLDNLMKTNPAIQRMVKAAGGPDKAFSLLQQQGGNPQMAKFLQQFLKSGKLPPGLPLGGP